MRRPRTAPWFLLLCVLVACDSASSGSSPDTAQPAAGADGAQDTAGLDAGPGTPDGSTPDAAPDAATADAATASPDAAPNATDASNATDATAPEEDAPARAGGPPAPRAYVGAHGCPALVQGKNTITSADKSRKFLLYLPDEPKGAPLLFLWHPAGGTAAYMAQAFGAEALSKKHGITVVVPDSCCGLVEWRFRDTEDATIDLALFDDLLYCLDEQVDVDNTRVYTGGFSAGALWSSYLVLHRSEFLAAAAIFSGGVDGLFFYETPSRLVPSLLAWGGEKDLYAGVFSFQQQTLALSEKLREDGGFVVECDHGLGHTVPFGGTSWAVPFVLAHRWGEPSPYATSGLDASFPDYCTIPE